jgi:hypothetical protein
MHDWERYRSNAADCLSDAHDACQPGHRNLNLFTAAAWLSLARQDEAIENVIASWNTPRVPEPRMASFIFSGCCWVFSAAFSRASNACSISTGSIISKPARSNQSHRERNPQSS